jgi:hypothetical protein
MNNIYDLVHSQLLTLIDHFILVANSIKGLTLQSSVPKRFVEPLAKKTISHIISSLSLFEGTKFRLSDNTYIQTVDFSSIAVLTRAALETYLTFNYIFVSPKENMDKEFRYYCWDLAGIIEREEFPTLDEQSNKVKRNEKVIKEQIKKELESNKYYQKLSKSEKRFLEKGNWRLGKSWNDLALLAGFNKNYFKYLYSYLCSYSHSGRLSILQIEQTKEIYNEKDFAKIYQTLNFMIVAGLLRDYVDLIPPCKKMYESNKNAVYLTKLGCDLIKNSKL